MLVLVIGPQLEFVPYGDWRVGVPGRDAAVTLDHLRHSPNCSSAKARARLGYEPRYTSLAAVQESVAPSAGALRQAAFTRRTTWNDVES